MRPTQWAMRPSSAYRVQEQRGQAKKLTSHACCRPSFCQADTRECEVARVRYELGPSFPCNMVSPYRGRCRQKTRPQPSGGGGTYCRRAAPWRPRLSAHTPRFPSLSLCGLGYRRQMSQGDGLQRPAHMESSPRDLGAGRRVYRLPSALPHNAKATCEVTDYALPVNTRDYE